MQWVKLTTIPNLPHLDWCIYSDGLATIFFKDKGHHSGATGKAGQMRSAWSLNQVIMLLMAIGPLGELIPNTNYRCQISGNRFIIIPNPTRVICNSILSAISYLFEMKREMWCPSLIDMIDMIDVRVRCMQVWCSIFFKLW